MRVLKWALLGLIGMVLALSHASAATNWDYYLYTGINHPVTDLLSKFADEVKTRTNGALIITVHPAGELPFKASEVVKIVGQDQVQMGSASPGFIAGSVDIGTVGNHVGLIRTPEDFRKAWPIIAKYIDPYFRRFGAKILFGWSYPTQEVFGNGPPIRSLADFRGRKIRVVAPEEAEMLKRLGASMVSLTTPEVAEALQRRVMEGLISSPITVVGSKWYEFLKWVYVADMHMGGPNYELVNIDEYNKLPADVRSALDQVAQEWAGRMNTAMEDEDVADTNALRNKYKLELNQATPADLQELNKDMQDYWDAWAQKQGPNGMAMMKELRAALGR